MTDEQRAERLRYHMYESNEGITQHAERIVALEELVCEFYEFVENVDALGSSASCTECCEHEDECIGSGECWFEKRMAALGIEVKG